MKRWWWLLPGAAGITLTLLIMVVFPPDRTIDSVWEVLYKVSPLVLAVLTIAGFPQKEKLGLILLAALMVGYMGAVDTLNVLHIFDFAEATDQAAAFPKLYQFTIFVNAFTVVAVLFGYRLGGASTANVLRAGFAAILIVISGLNDLSFYYTADWQGPRPERLEWASHISVFVGGPATPTVAIIFCVVHLLLAALILLWPRRRATVAGAADDTPVVTMAANAAPATAAADGGRSGGGGDSGDGGGGGSGGGD